LILFLLSSLLLVSPSFAGDEDLTDGKQLDTVTCLSPSLGLPLPITIGALAHDVVEVQRAVTPKYQTIPMQSGYDPASDRANGIPYLTPAKREKYKIHFKDGKLYYKRWWGLSKIKKTPAADPPFHAGFMFVMDEQGNLYMAAESEVKHHSAFLAGGPVAAAGILFISNAKIVEINNLSGHYRPTQEIYQQALRELKENGINMSEIKNTVY
jgi:hypothetical protein